MQRKVAMAIALAMAAAFCALPVFAGGLVKAVSKNPEAQKLIDQAWAMEKEESNAEVYKKCIPLLEQADRLDPENPEILSELSRYYWSYGDWLPKETHEQQRSLERIYDKGLSAADKSLKLKETSVAHYWCAVNKAAGKEFSSIFAQAAAFPAIYEHYKYVATNDPDYYYGGAGRLWSEVLSRVPKQLVEIVGRKYLDEAMQQIDRAIKQEPRFMDNYVYKARFMHVFYGNNEEALRLLDTEMKMHLNCFPEEIAANRVSKDSARQLWKEITGKEYPLR
jgi:tetratricopeptide (TPR) repeat protein